MAESSRDLLKEAVRVLGEAVETATDKFRFYAQQHEAKHTPESDVKMQANLELVTTMCITHSVAARLMREAGAAAGREDADARYAGPGPLMLDRMAVKIHGPTYKHWTTDRVTGRRKVDRREATRFEILTPAEKRGVMGLCLQVIAVAKEPLP